MRRVTRIVRRAVGRRGCVRGRGINRNGGMNMKFVPSVAASSGLFREPMFKIGSLISYSTSSTDSKLPPQQPKSNPAQSIPQTSQPITTTPTTKATPQSNPGTVSNPPPPKQGAQNLPPNFNWDEFRRQSAQKMQTKQVEEVIRTPKSNKPYYFGLVLIITALGVTAYYLVEKLTPKVPLPEGFVKQRVVILGTGWAAVSIVRGLDPELYDVTVVSPSNYFVFTPLLSSATIGTVNERSIIEPIRDMANGQFKYIKGKAKDIDLEKKIVTCTSSASKVVSNTIKAPATHTAHTPATGAAVGQQPLGKLAEEDSVQKVSAQVIDKVVFSLPYDKLIVAVGAKNNTFGTPGVVQHCHFLKSIKDVRQIKEKISSCLELANLPNSTEEFKKKILSFVIVGGGPTGVETAGELKEFMDTTVEQKFPGLAKYGKITLVQTLDHLLNTFDMKIGKYTEKEFVKRNINVMYKTRAIGVDKEKVIVESGGVKSELDYGLCIWATGLGVNPFVTLLRDKINTAAGGADKEVQKNKNVLITDSWLRVKGVQDVFALGDCSSIDHPRLVEHCLELFQAADVDKDKCLSLTEFIAEVDKEKRRFPQLEIVAVKAAELFNEYDKDRNQALDYEEFKAVMAKVDSQITRLPATAQVASQQGEYLSKVFNEVTRGGGQIETRTMFNYKHMGSFAYIGSDKAVGEFSNKWTIQGLGAWWLWRSVYWSMQYSWKNKVSIGMDWIRTSLFGRDVTL